MTLMRYEPFKGLDKFFETLAPTTTFANMGWDLAVDLYEEGGELVAEMNLPGVDPEKLEISVEEGHLRIAGTREEMSEKKEANYYSKEIKRGSFERLIYLPFKVKENEAKAEYNNGVLKVRLPKDEGKRIKVNLTK
ncbi:MAG: Hsp20/alpha crystallin family protein [Planctomycetota bacterium]|nr:MAG: Hsp20/alpha crystallin family protein [Planctomycetota bacterium]